jgi:hypothetical protein
LASVNLAENLISVKHQKEARGFTMNKWVERAIFINIIFIILYILSDYAMWTRIPADMEGITQRGGTFEELRVRTFYKFVTKWIEVGADWRYLGTFQGVSCVSELPNFSLILFLTALLANMLLLWKATGKSDA